MAIIFSDDPRSFMSGTQHKLGEKKIFDCIKEQTDGGIRNFILPTLVKTDMGIRIKTIERVESKKDKALCLMDNGRYKEGYTVTNAYTRLFLVFDYNNQIKPECFTGECTLTKMDSIAYITIPYSQFGAKVEYWLDVIDKVNKYVVNNSMYYMARPNGTYMDDRVGLDNTPMVIPYKEMLESTKYKVPTIIKEYLQEGNLLGCQKRIVKTFEDSHNGTPMKRSVESVEWVDGVLNKFND